jgi:hypothetical protein
MGAIERTVEELRRDVEAHTASWAAVRRATEPADRERAEAAIRDLYAGRGLEAPQIVWVPSPAAGVLAWHVASRGREPVRNPYTRGDLGTGDNQPFNALADPFGPEPKWTRRIIQATEQGLAPLGNGQGWRPAPVFERIAVAIGLGGNVVGSIAAALRERHGLSPWGRSERAQPVELPIARDPGLARIVVGDRWAELEAVIGSQLLEQVALEGIAKAVSELLDPAASVRAALQAMHPGQFDTSLAATRLLPDVLGARRIASPSASRLDRSVTVARSAGPWWALERLAIVSERPLRLSLDERGMLHSTEGPALAYADGFALWADHGVTVPAWLVTEPERLAVKHIDAERNTEVRRVMIERFGAERLVREGGSTLVHEDAAGRLWRREFTEGWSEPVVMVEVVNSTPEPDGSHRTYFLRVPPSTRSATAAVAWTFGMRESEYTPAQQT